ncbi:Uncharacterised protein [Vibrio cholerae]|nr:Uncharacterised protein [Vibrio cholerae]
MVVYWALLSCTMGFKPRRRQRSFVSVKQMSPRPWVAIKLIAAGVMCSAAMIRSPSFSRSSSSIRMTILP